MNTHDERMTGRVPVEHGGRDLDLMLSIKQSSGDRLYLATRRVVEVIMVLLCMPIVALLLPLIGVANWLIAPGDLFYVQERIGQAGEPFKLIKFRTMVMDAEKGTGAVWASPNDKRITPVGRLLRKTHLDELPQLWNILKGEMSLIGPRPERPHFVKQLAEEIPFYRIRHTVKPGLTGWAQVKYTYGASVEDALVKLQYDLYYIKHQGPYLDLLILIQTVRVVLGFKGR